MRTAALLSGLSLLGCGSDGKTSPADATVTPPDAAFAPGHAWIGVEGELAVMLVSATPLPPQRDLNEWVVAIEDAQDRQPTTGCELRVSLYMPAHGHAAPQDPVVEPGPEAGRYTVEDIHFSMPGTWEVTFEPRCGALTDRVVVSLEIPR